MSVINYTLPIKILTTGIFIWVVNCVTASLAWARIAPFSTKIMGLTALEIMAAAARILAKAA
jgi:uncharacterized membrane protein YvlD (DUF360 family)